MSTCNGVIQVCLMQQGYRDGAASSDPSTLIGPAVVTCLVGLAIAAYFWITKDHR